MIECFAANTTNSRRAVLMLEECELPYSINRIDLSKGENDKKEFLALNPAGQVPVVIDPEGPSRRPITLVQSAAIVIYLAEKSGRLIPADAAERFEAMRWVMFAMSDLSPSASALFLLSPQEPQTQAAIDVFRGRLLRFLRLTNRRLGEVEYLAGSPSIADVSLYPLIVFPLVAEAMKHSAEPLIHLQRWQQAMAARPAVARTMQAFPVPKSG